jgi:hypothetical protein
MPLIEGKGLVYTQPIYDTVAHPVAAAGATVLNLFAVPYGGLLVGAVNKGWRHTNLVQAGRLELGNEIQINAITVGFPYTAEAGALPTVADIAAIRSGVFKLILGGNTEFLKIPTAQIPNGGFTAYYQNSNAAAALDIYGGGVPVTQNKYFLDEPLVLHSQESVKVELSEMDAVAAITEVVVFLHGTSARPVR